jgi:hypothetical protein
MGDRTQTGNECGDDLLGLEGEVMTWPGHGAPGLVVTVGGLQVVDVVGSED